MKRQITINLRGYRFASGNGSAAAHRIKAALTQLRGADRIEITAGKGTEPPRVVLSLVKGPGPAKTAALAGAAPVPAVQTAYAGLIIPEFVAVKAGKFLMGCEKGAHDERPVREVTITKPFGIAKHPVTFAEYLEFLKATDEKNLAPFNIPEKGRYPAAEVTWFEAVKYCEWLTGLKMPGKDGKPRFFRLPTEAEWEYAARGPARSFAADVLVTATKAPCAALTGPGHSRMTVFVRSASVR